MSEPFRIDRLSATDAVRAREMNVLFGEAFADQDAYGAEPPADVWFTEVLARDHVIALVATAEGRIVGGLVAYELDKLERARREIYIYDLAVAEPFRRRGVATALIGRLREIARSRGAWVIYVQADYGDDPAVALYEKLGTREDVMHFDIAP
jgi:aminoglycoside 3-N-acetyltransferase I